jgi:photosystem II stability/assembly factor-like uncharacterized protein
MGTSLYLATTVGLFIASQVNGNWTVTGKALEGQALTSVAASARVILAGSAAGLFRSEDNGRSWQPADAGLSIPHVRWLEAFPHPSPFFLAGTEPAAIFVSHDGAATWSHDPAVPGLRDAHGWFLPYSPRAGCVRGFAQAPAGPRKGRVYAAVEVGGVLVSEDSGRSWRLAPGSDGKPDMNRDLGKLIHPDVHSISVHPASPDIVTAATGGGLFRSTDAGRSWKNIYPAYIRAARVDPADPDHIVAGPADGVARNGRIEATRDGGKTWRPASEGLEAPWPRHMVERFAQAGETLIAVLSNGELWARGPGSAKWERILSEAGQVKALAVR